MNRTLKIILILIIMVVIAGYGIHLLQNQKREQSIEETQTPKIRDPLTVEKVEDDSTVTIMVPENYAVYQEKITEFVQEGTEDPLNTIKFDKKAIHVSNINDPIRASAQAAAREIKPHGGPEYATLSYLKVVKDTAYVLLDIDLDHWAGSSVSIAQIHPLVEKTLLQFPEIDYVVFDYAPGN